MIYTFREATAMDVETIFAFVEKRIHWMDKNGIRQWNVTGYLDTYPIDYYKRQEEQGHLYVLHDQMETVVGAVVLLEEDDRWADRIDSSAFYVHNLVTDSEVHGAGSLIIKEAEKMAIRLGKEYMRLDCAADNSFLNQYYEDHGYLLVGTCKDGPYIGNRREKKLH